MEWNLEEAVRYYGKQGAPGDQGALKSLLREIQENCGGSVPASAVEAVCEHYRVKQGLILALIKRIPSLRLGERHVLEICAGPNCGKRRELAEFVESRPRPFDVKYVPCMRMCGKGPNVRWDGKVYHGVTVEKLREMIEE